MKTKYRLRNWVVASIYVFAVSAVVVSFALLNKFLKDGVYSNETLSYVYKGIIEDDVKPVVNYNNEEIIKPFDAENIDVEVNFYDKDAPASDQEKSLIKYQNTYMPNTGILYKADESFDVLSVLDGTVADITADEIIGNIVTIKHSNNLVTVYESLNEVKVLIGDLIKKGDVIGTSGSNKISSSSENMLLFEVINNGEYINPEKFYSMKSSELE